ncbi:MAG: zinc ribbon domain-containing protein [Candidatus Dormibacteraeota bacterium]|nr:zinc ribbon domain-containing protein [Candidatus Dormibacteraeota bacterium]
MPTQRGGTAAGDLSGQFCPNCGAPITPRETACKFCGEQLAPFFLPQVGRARRGGMERGVLYSLIGCGGLLVLAIGAFIFWFAVALASQGGNSENGYSCSPGPCADAQNVDMAVTKISAADLTGVPRARYRTAHYLRFQVHLDVSGTKEISVNPSDFGLVERNGAARPRAEGFPACPTWSDLPATGYGAAIPAICYAVDDTEVRHYKMTWTMLKPGQQITLYLPKGN